ncbi:MAG: hypothetical protein QNJ34_20385 [Xenococcaceae cyanobacterium MO_188.B29]|nr:hypothetical protein [Xenococcaceae cyanobacterium MO_188.B29]
MTEASQSTNKPATAEEIAAVITEFEQYRERLLNETMAAAKKAKLPQKTALAQLEPQLAKIDLTLEKLREQKATLTEAN